MDAHALLTSQGWRGTGHSLHKTDDAIGLARPILVSRKNNALGIGRKNHVTSDSWWLNAFDEQLKSLDTSNKTSVVQAKTNTTKLEGLLTHGAGKYTGANALYACFVSGGLLKGTLHETDEGESTDATPEAEAVPVRKETKAERRARREAKRLRREERRARREGKRQRKAERIARKSAAAVKAPEPIKSKHDSKDKAKSKKDTKTRKIDIIETKEERRARKETKRKDKAKRETRKKAEQG
ncbi:unnamed protein product [Discula destructiva]